MRTLNRTGIALVLVAIGYTLGVSSSFVNTTLQAQNTNQGPSAEAIEQIRLADEALGAAAQALLDENLYVPAMKGPNAFAILAGGVDAVRDLENNRGVDPVTFAALYADLATEEVAEHLDRDAEGRLTYKNKVVRMYPISRLKRLFAERSKLSGESIEDEVAPEN